MTTWRRYSTGSTTDLVVPCHDELNLCAVFWFREGTTALIRRVWEVVPILREENVFARLLVTRRPGYVVYADPHQVAAIHVGNDGCGPASVPDSTAVFGTARRGSIPRRGTEKIRPRSVGDSHATLRRSKTRFDSWRGQCTMSPGGRGFGPEFGETSFHALSCKRLVDGDVQMSGFMKLLGTPEAALDHEPEKTWPGF